MCRASPTGNSCSTSTSAENVTREEAEQAAATWVLVGPDVSAKIRRVIGYFSLNGFNLAKKQTLC
jgi:hypothetical protein